MCKGFSAINPLASHGIATAITITRHHFQGSALLSENVTAGMGGLLWQNFTGQKKLITIIESMLFPLIFPSVYEFTKNDRIVYLYISHAPPAKGGGTKNGRSAKKPHAIKHSKGIKRAGVEWEVEFIITRVIKKWTGIYPWWINLPKPISPFHIPTSYS